MPVEVEDIILAEEEAIRLIPPGKDQRVNETNPPVEWCVSRRLREELEEKGIKNPQLLLVVTNGETELWREVVPLFNMLHYVPFYRPGRNTVHAKPLYEDKFRGSPRDILRKKKEGQYVHEFFDHTQPEMDRLRSLLEVVDDQEKRELLEKEMELHRKDPQECVLRDEEDLTKEVNFLEGKGELSFDVSEEAFAAKPHPVLAWIANFGFETKPKDQCHLKRRALIKLAFSWVLLPALLLALLVIETINLAVVGFLALWGMRSISLQALWHPFTFWPSTAWDDLKPSYWGSKKGEPNEDGEPTYHERPELLQMFAPPVVVTLALIVFGVSILTGPVNLLAGIVLAVGIIVALVVLLAAYSLAVHLLKRLFGKSYAERSKARKAKREARKQEAREREAKEFAEELEQLTCASGEKGTPRQRQAVRLRVQAHKSDRCKQFPQ